MLGLTSVALTVLFVFPAGSPAAAQPPITVADAKALIERLQNDAAGIDQQYTGVREQIKKGRGVTSTEAGRRQGSDRQSGTDTASSRSSRARPIPKPESRYRCSTLRHPGH